jgi:hypothetical protein
LSEVRDARVLVEALDELEELANKAHDLADYLGDDHDLAVVAQTMTDLFPTEGNGSHGGTWSPLIQRRRGGLQEDALRLGDDLYRERPQEFIRHLKAYWKAWRAEREAAQSA